MTTQETRSGGSEQPPPTRPDAEILELAPLVRRVVAARVSDPASVDDLVQEALVRVLEARPRLEPAALAPYAVATARNLAYSLHRTTARHKRNEPRLHDPAVPEGPDEATLRREEDEAVGAALASLSERDRETLVAHEVEGVDTATLAARLHTTPGAVAVRLARARATLRVDWLVAYRGVELPTDRCRPVLIALSGGDRRRQRELDAPGHLRTCPECADLSSPLVERRRSLAVFLPVIGLWWLVKLLWDWSKAHKAAAAAGAASLTLTGALVWPRADRPAPPPAAAPPPPTAPGPATTLPPPPPAPTTPAPAIPGVTVGGQPLRPREGLGQHDGALVSFDAAGVTDGDGDGEVDADEGFWVGGPAGRVWVQFTDRTESPPTVTTGSRVTFTGRMVPNRPRDGYAGRVGATSGEGGALLERQGYHVEVHSSRVRLS
jgi:RNA polymerase sigma factor (sigma-70 family)